MGEAGKGTGGAVDALLELDVVGKVLAALVLGRPVRAYETHVLEERVRGLDGRLGPPHGELPGPVGSLEGLCGRPLALEVGLQVPGVHIGECSTLQPLPVVLAWSQDPR